MLKQVNRGFETPIAALPPHQNVAVWCAICFLPPAAFSEVNRKELRIIRNAIIRVAYKYPSSFKAGARIELC